MRSPTRVSLLAAAAALWLAQAAATELPAGLTAGGTAQVRQVDGPVLLLADGRRLRLAGIDLPLVRRRGAAPTEAEALLANLTAAQPIALYSAGNPIDRHGDALAQVVVGETWLQGELVRRGLARVHGFADNRAGLAALLALEAAARQAGIGLWADPSFAVRHPDDAGRFTGSFQIVEGTVLDESKTSAEGDVWLHFGSDQHATLSLRLDRDARRLCREAKLDLKTLTGQRIRVRGFIDGTSRPAMAVGFPEQIERLGPG